MAESNGRQFKGPNFPANVAVRDIAVQPREGDLVLATHGRGIWIIRRHHAAARTHAGYSAEGRCIPRFPSSYAEAFCSGRLAGGR